MTTINKKIQLVLLYSEKSGIIYKDDNKFYIDEVLTSYLGVDHYHLYFLSDEEIKVGDWVLLRNEKPFPYQVTKEAEIRTANEVKMKIIASTDTSLKKYLGMLTDGESYFIDQYEYIPKPTLQFIKEYIEEYNKGNIILDVLVEYEQCDYIAIKDNNDRCTTCENGCKYPYPRLKVDKHNQITITIENNAPEHVFCRDCDKVISVEDINKHLFMQIKGGGLIHWNCADI